MTILYINRSDSVCGDCNRTCDPYDEFHTSPTGYDQHAGCGAKFTHLSSHYSDFEGMYDRIKSMRPDLEFVGSSMTVSDYWVNRKKY